MKSTKFFYSLILLVSLACAFYACKKNDYLTDTKLEHKKSFFDNIEKSGELANRIATFINSKNEKENYINNIIKKGGYPVWNKIITNKDVNIITAVNYSIESVSGDTLAIIPLVEETDGKVEAFLKATINNTVNDIDLYCGEDYTNYENKAYSETEFSAEKFVMNFALLNYLVNGDKTFETTNDSLFMKGTDRSKTVNQIFINLKETNPATSTGQLRDLSYTCITLIIENCPYVGRPSCSPTCDRCELCVSSLEMCWYSGGGSVGPGSPSIYIPPSGGSLTGGGSSANSNPLGNDIGIKVGGPAIKIIDYNNYKLNAHDKEKFDKIDRELEEADQLKAGDCKGTMRLGNEKWKGVLEHWMIMLYYQNLNPLTNTSEYKIPNAGPTPGNPGYCDLVNTFTGEMFEIKSTTPSQINLGAQEVNNYVIKTNANCPRGMNPYMGSPNLGAWRKGEDFPTVFLPNPRNTKQVLEVKKNQSGVITYEPKDKTSVSVPLPVLAPQSQLDRIKQLWEKLKSKTVDEYDSVIAGFLNNPQNADLRNFLRDAAVGVAVGLIVSTIVEDILTAGVGILDDWASFALAYRILRFAKI